MYSTNKLSSAETESRVHIFLKSPILNWWYAENIVTYLYLEKETTHHWGQAPGV